LICLANEFKLTEIQSPFPDNLAQSNKVFNGRILLAEDDHTSAAILIRILEKSGYDVEWAKNGLEALQIFSKDKDFKVIITDINMPNLSGKDLIKKILPSAPWISIIVITSDSALQTAVEVMKEGVFDYLVKPFNYKEIIVRLDKAIEFTNLKKKQELYESEKVERIEKQLEWYNYKEQNSESLKADSKLLHTNMYHNLRTNLSQGAGFGALISLADMIKSLPSDEKGNKTINKKIVKMFEDNVKFSNNVLDEFSSMEVLTTSQIELQEHSLFELYETIENVKISLKDKQNLKGQIVSLSKWTYNGNQKVMINKELFSYVINELLLNAFKFSPENRSIYILFYIQQSKFQITFLNKCEVTETTKNGIPEEYHNLIFEPFFRLTRLVFSDYNTLDYGLGLCKCRVILQKFGGKIQVGNIIDHLSKERGTMVEFSLFLPLTNI
jgi:DNA-binding response OmpR family regulator